MVMDRRMHSGVCQAAATLVPTLPQVSDIFKIKLIRKREKESCGSDLLYETDILVAQWPAFAGTCYFREVATPGFLAEFSVAPGHLLSPPVPHVEKHSQRSILG